MLADFLASYLSILRYTKTLDVIGDVHKQVFDMEEMGGGKASVSFLYVLRYPLACISMIVHSTVELILYESTTKRG
jgi:hypothetical protein